MTKKTQVLIVGAGPTGLMMAAQLAAYDIDYIIVDKKKGPTSQSRALGIQARTLEIFRQMGVVNDFLKEGTPAKAVNFATGNNLVAHVPLSDLGKGLTEYPFMLMLEQSRTERILIKKIHTYAKDINWESEVTLYTQTNTGAQIIVKDSSGNETTIHADWVIGADGAHSVIRHAVGGHLWGKTYKQSLFVLDCKVDFSFPRDELTVIRSKHTFAAFFPMKDGLWRIVGEVPASAIGKDTIAFQDIQEHFAERLESEIQLHDPKWISLYKSHQRSVRHFRFGRAFLLGDAAHIHSPVGAQGMNTGLQDAYNLAWKIALVCQKKASEKLLDTYEAERKPFAQRLVATTDKAFSLILRKNPLIRDGLRFFLPIFIKAGLTQQVVRNLLFKTVSQIGITYRATTPKNATYGDFPENTPMPGDRLPYITYKDREQQTISLQELVSQSKFLVILLQQNKKVFSVDSLQSSLVETHRIIFSASTEHIFKQLGIHHEGCYIIRPDMYIAYRSQDPDIKTIQDYFTKLN